MRKKYKNQGKLSSYLISREMERVKFTMDTTYIEREIEEEKIEENRKRNHIIYKLRTLGGDNHHLRATANIIRMKLLGEARELLMLLNIHNQGFVAYGR